MLAVAGVVSGVATPEPAASPVAYSREIPDAAGEHIDDTIVLDVAGVRTDGVPQTIVALGEGKSCGCPVLLQSTDAGSTWTVGAGPAIEPASARLVIPVAYPTDPRVEIIAGTGEVLVTTRFGQPFESAPAGIAGSELSRAPCGRDSRGPLRCLGLEVASPPQGDAENAGSAVSLGDGWLLYLQPRGGLACSHGGRTWSSSCASQAV